MKPAILDDLTDFDDGSENGWVRGRAGRDITVLISALNLTPGRDGFSGVIYQKNFFLEIGAQYEFSLIARNYAFGTQDVMPKFRLMVEADLNTPTYTLPRDLEWHSVKGTFIATQHRRLFEIRNDEDSGAGNDYYLDDIRVKQLTRGTPWIPSVQNLKQTTIPTLIRGRSGIIPFILESNGLPDYPGARLEFQSVENIQTLSLTHTPPGTVLVISPDQSMGTVTVTPKIVAPWPVNQSVTVQTPLSATPGSIIAVGTLTYFDSVGQAQASTNISASIGQTTVTGITQTTVPLIELGARAAINFNMSTNEVPDFDGARIEVLSANGSILAGFSDAGPGTELVIAPDGSKCTVTVKPGNTQPWPNNLTVQFSSSTEDAPGSEVTLATLSYFNHLNEPGPTLTLKAKIAGTTVSGLVQQTLPIVSDQFATVKLDLVMETNGGVDFERARIQGKAMGGLIMSLSNTPPGTQLLISPDALKGSVTVTDKNTVAWQRNRSIDVQIRSFASPGATLDACEMTYFDSHGNPGVSSIFKVKLEQAIRSINVDHQPTVTPGSSATFNFVIESNTQDAAGARLEASTNDMAALTHITYSLPSEIAEISDSRSISTITIAPHTSHPWQKSYLLSVEVDASAPIGEALEVGSFSYFNNSNELVHSLPLRVNVTNQPPIKSTFTYGTKWQDLASERWIYSYIISLEATLKDIQQWRTSFTQLPHGTQLFTSTWATVTQDGGRGVIEFQRPAGPSYYLEKNQPLHMAIQLIYPKEAGEQKRFEILWDLSADDLD